MKVRKSFVSNSSTTSFVLVGVSLNRNTVNGLAILKDDEDKDLWLYFEDNEPELTCLYDDETNLYYVGKLLAEDNCGKIESRQFTLEEFENEISSMKQKLEELQIPFDDVKIMCGTVYC